jgi:hypothetical protein
MNNTVISKTPRLIGLCGKANVGKDHIARLIQSHFGYRPFSFALHIKMNMIGKTGYKLQSGGVEYTYEDVMVNKPPHMRDEIQIQGTELGRNVYGEDVWVKITDAWLRFFSEQWDIHRFVIADVRFENEANYIKSNNGILVRVKSDRVQHTKLTPEQQAHESEVALDHKPDEFFNGIVVNNVNTRNHQLIEQLDFIWRTVYAKS